MAMALTLEEYLKDSEVSYDILTHTPTMNSMSTAAAAHVSGDLIAKSVILEDESGYLMVVVPATHHLNLGHVSNLLNRRLGLATEEELAELFWDCDLGAIPPIGDAYGMEVIMDESLGSCPDVFFESGDHTHLVHMTGKEFRELMSHVDHAQISYHI